MPNPSLLHPEPLSLRQSTADPYLLRRHSNRVLSQSLWGLWFLMRTGLFEPPEHLWRVWGLILNVILPLLSPCWEFSFAPGCGVSPHSCFSTYYLAGVSLPLDVGYLTLYPMRPLRPPELPLEKPICRSGSNS